MTLEGWYHRAAVVIWPREEHFAVLCGAGTDAALGGLEPMVKRLRRARKADRAVLRHIVRDLDQNLGIYATIVTPGTIRSGDAMTFV